MRVLLAFDKFKDSMSASEACAVAASAIRRTHPKWELDLCPIADGSDGFSIILTQAREGELIHTTVTGPNFKEVEAHFGLVDCGQFSLSSKAWLKLPDRGKVAVMEMAQASGLQYLHGDERNLWYTSSYGTGELLMRAVQMKPEVIIMGVGGSATHDLGLGALEAMGLRFRAENGDLITHITPNHWSRVVAIEGELPKNLPRIVLAPNVHNKLLGSHGAVALFGAQKGLKKMDFAKLEEQTARMAELLVSHFDIPRSVLDSAGSGAAGGLAIGLQAAFKVQMDSGVALADRWLRLNERIERANIVITGEGRFDMGSLEGKGPQYVIERASNRGKRIYCFVGQYLAGDRDKLPEGLHEAKIEQISPPGTSPEQSISGAIAYLTETVKRAFADMA